MVAESARGRVGRRSALLIRSIRALAAGGLGAGLPPLPGRSLGSNSLPCGAQVMQAPPRARAARPNQAVALYNDGGTRVSRPR